MAENLRNERSACGVICEYNPFHRGHLYQLSELKTRFGCVVSILGGELTQRGEVAVRDSRARAAAALAGGADLVIGLPLPWCCASAEDFARGGVALAEALAVDALAFSAESDGEILQNAAAKRNASEAEISALIRTEKLSFPKAVERVCGIPLEGRPNDILALEYLRFVQKADVLILKREPSFPSSRAVRESDDPASLLPECALPLLPFRKTETMYPFLRSALLNRPVRDCYAMTDELFASLAAASVRPDAPTLQDFLSLTASKQFTFARVRRALWSSAFGFPRELPRKTPPYALLLAANGTGRRWLKEHRQSFSVPVVSRPAALKGDPVFALNLRVSRVLNVFFGGKDPLEQAPLAEG